MSRTMDVQGVLAYAASGLDRLVARALVRRRLEAAGGAEERPDLARITADYDRPEHYTDPRTFFGEPILPRPRLTLVRRLDAEGQVVDASWPSCAPFHPAMMARHVSSPENQSAAARLWLHRAPPRGAAILVHGYLGGRYAFEDLVWPARRFYDRGFDVALATLPFHGVRAANRERGRPSFPSADPRITNEGIRQAIFDLRGLMRLLQARGAARVGAMGMSLGGYAVALLATLEPELAFAVPVVPLADLTEFARGDVPFAAPHADAVASLPDMSRVHRVVSPLARRPALAPERVLVVGAAADRIAPLAHARELADHFGAALEVLPGGHLLQLGRTRAFHAVERLLDRSCPRGEPRWSTS